jgi:hypothetical protein
MVELDLSTRYVFSKTATITFAGRTMLKTPAAATADVTALTAIVKTADGEITTGLQYRWTDVTESPNIVINQDVEDWAEKYALRNTAEDATIAELGTNVPGPANRGFNEIGKTLVVSSDAITSTRVFMLEVHDTVLDYVYMGYVTVSDQSDPYTVTLNSSAGTTFVNKVGTTQLWPTVRYGSAEMAELRYWTFQYVLRAADGSAAGFIDTTRLASGSTVLSNTAYGTNFRISIQNLNQPFISGDLVKVVAPDYSARYFKVGVTSTGSSIILESTAEFPATDILADGLVGGKLYLCVGNGADAGRLTRYGMLNPSWTRGSDYGITVHAVDVDQKAQVIVQASRPSTKELKLAGLT